MHLKESNHQVTCVQVLQAVLNEIILSTFMDASEQNLNIFRVKHVE